MNAFATLLILLALAVLVRIVTTSGWQGLLQWLAAKFQPVGK